MNKLYLIFLILLTIPFTFGTTCALGENCEIYSVIVNGTSFYPASSAQFSLSDSNGTVLLNESMQNIGVGQFYYNFTPNFTGVFIGQTLFDNIYIGLEQVTIQEDYAKSLWEENKMIALILGLGIFIAVVTFISYLLLTAERFKEEKGLVSVLVFTLVFFVFWGMLFILKESVINLSFAPVVDTLFIVYSIVFGVGSTIVFFIVSLMLALKMFTNMKLKKEKNNFSWDDNNGF